MKDNRNKKVLGKFKDEMGSLLIKEFTALNPKVYSIIHQQEDENKVFHEKYSKKTCKGVSKVVVKKEINHNDYQEVLNTNQSKDRTVSSIRSCDHQLYTYEQTNHNSFIILL